MDLGHHFIALHATAEDGATLSVEVLGGHNGEVNLDSDGIMVLQIASINQGIRIKATKSGKSEIKTFSLKNLTLAAAE